jgi:hypothetical protein
MFPVFMLPHGKIALRRRALGGPKWFWRKRDFAETVQQRSGKAIGQLIDPSLFRGNKTRGRPRP